MRHQKKGRKLNRDSSHRRATLRQLACNLIAEEQVKTTVSKAKELQPFVEKIITRGEEDTVHNRRQVNKKMVDKEAVKKVFEELGPRFADRPGGYTRIIKLDRRKGDGAPRALIEFVE